MSDICRLIAGRLSYRWPWTAVYGGLFIEVRAVPENQFCGQRVGGASLPLWHLRRSSPGAHCLPSSLHCRVLFPRREARADRPGR